MTTSSLSVEISHRHEFADLCNARGLRRAVEVGTDRGGFARQFLDRWYGEILWCVDPYASYGHMPWDRESDRLLAIAHLAPHADRVRFIRHPSVEAVRLLGDHVIEFAYIDGSHAYADVAADLEMWWGKLWPEGPTILAGHDYDADHHEVMRAVGEFARAKRLTVRVTSDYPASWYVYRNEPEELACISPA